MKYFHINNIKFNYTLEFQSNQKNDYWKNNAPLLEYCETLGINIPHYCYHKGLSISGNCRMCLVELKNSPKPMVSCAISAKSCLNNSEVFTDSPLVKKARENVLEFLLLNHPLDCPICDQGGECDLQDQSYVFGISKKRFYNFKRVVSDKNIGPIVKTVMTRCIHCTRCVRFADEVAGVDDLGMFGRGVDSEIGTYVEKTFQSELSGNIIDLCPVGALTSKPYPFLSRSWELKNVDTVDNSDSFCENLTVSLKNNKIVKILPRYSFSERKTPWISNKTRFSFDGVLSPERQITNSVTYGHNKTEKLLNWESIFKEIIKTIYFQDHLSRHILKVNSLIVVLNNSISLEALSLLLIISKKYNFIKLRKSENCMIDSSFSNDFIINSENSNIEQKIADSTACLLIGVNTRYEGATLDTQLRKRYLKGNFKILSLSSQINLTYPVTNVSLNVKSLVGLLDGTEKYCRTLMSSLNPVIIVGSEIFKRQHNLGTLLKRLKSKLSSYHSNWNNLHVLNSSVNEVGNLHLGNFKTLSESDFSNNYGIYFINTSQNELNLNKILNLKLLNYFCKTSPLPYLILNQNAGYENKYSNTVEQSSGIYNHINLSNGTALESNNTYVSADGSFKNTTKVLNINNNIKEDWQILRKFLSSSTNLTLSTCFYETVYFNSKSLNLFKNFIGFMYFPSNNLSKLNFYLLNKLTNFSVIIKNTLKTKKHKFNSTPIKLWISDFYIGGKDLYNKSSVTMIKCSKSYRLDITNFNTI